ncbi:hypothetical protein LPJ66_002533 [Kickxella alabastrina]|uniref:Uncharacterized protein n=1 Tax=Kickxella alabastrina TaxID=61397 RepID=A0ACC1IQH8_9FUNG|nr:hypothetical protein LPJ66_002533 [Kickxella alabastrina]
MDFTSLSTVLLLPNAAKNDPRISRATTWLAKIAKLDEPKKDTTDPNTDTNAVADYILNSNRIDLAIAAAIRSRQLDREGNKEGAAQLFAFGLEHMALALRDTRQIRDVYVRERLDTLKILLSESTEIHTDAVAFSTNSTAVKTKPTHSSHLQLPAENVRDLDTHGVTILAVMSFVLDLVNRIIIMWLVLLGNALVWASMRFKNSEMPEILAKYLMQLFSWLTACIRYWNLQERTLRLCGMVWVWMASVDGATGFWQRVACSVATVLAAFSRVVEESTRMDSDKR